MSVTANLTTNVETITATIVVEDETIIVQVSAAARGPAGEAGAAGAAGPNAVTTATTTNLTGFISGNGTNIAGATAAATTATANTLVLRSAGGGASFAGLNTNSGSYAQIGGENFNVATTTAANLTATGSGTVTVSGAGGTTIGGGTLTFSPSGFAYGAGAASAHRTALGLGTGDSPTFAGEFISGADPNVQVSNTSATNDSARFTSRGISVSRNSDGLYSATILASEASGQKWVVNSREGVGLRYNSSEKLSITVSGVTISGTLTLGSANQIDFNSDTIITRDAANTLAQRNGTAQQESRIYGTYTGPGNYRRLALKMSNAGVAQIVAEGGGSGAADNRLEFVTGGATRMTVAADGVVTASNGINIPFPSIADFTDTFSGNAKKVSISSAGVSLRSDKRVTWSTNVNSSSGDVALSHGSVANSLALGDGLANNALGILQLKDLTASGTVQTGGYTFANLPTPTTGMRAYITDGAAIPVYMANAAGGGSTVTPVFYNGTNWINA